MKNNFFENDYAKFRIHNDILIIEYKANIILNLTIAQRLVADRVYIQNEKDYFILFDMRKLADSDKPGRTTSLEQLIL